MSACTIRGGINSRPAFWDQVALAISPDITTVEELHAAAVVRFTGRKVTQALLVEAEQWRMVVAPDVPAEFAGEYQRACICSPPSPRDPIIGITLVDKRS